MIRITTAPRYLGLCLIALFAVTPALGQQGEVDEAEMMKKWGEFKTPGEAHEHLKYKVGEWKFTSKMWMSPDAPPEASDGTAKFEMILGGRYLQDHTEGEFSGMPFKGRGVTGYNNATGKYISFWIDNFGTGFMSGEGTYDESNKEWNYKATSTDPMVGKEVTYRYTEKIVDDNTWVMTMYAPGPDGEEFKSMELTYKRVQ